MIITLFYFHQAMAEFDMRINGKTAFGQPGEQLTLTRTGHGINIGHGIDKKTEAAFRGDAWIKLAQ